MVTVSADQQVSSTVKYEWDARDRLTAVETVGLSRSEFLYDGLGRRVRIVEKDSIGNVTARRWFVWEGLTIREERTDASGAPGAVVKRFYGDGEERGATKYFYTRDHLGSLREVTDGSGALVARYEYDAYGQVTRTAGSENFDFLCRGHLYHGMSGMYLAPYRAYDPRLGRWTSKDPIGIDGGVNLYSYVAANPFNAYDPDGRDIVVLFDTQAFHGFGHPAVLVGDDSCGWYYFSWSTGHSMRVDSDNLEMVRFATLAQARHRLWEFDQYIRYRATGRQDVRAFRAILQFRNKWYLLAGRNCEDLASAAVRAAGEVWINIWIPNTSLSTNSQNNGAEHGTWGPPNSTVRDIIHGH